MADTIDRVQVEVEATAKGTSAVFKQLEQQLTVIKQAMQSIDTSKLNAMTKVNTSGMSRAEKDISSSVDKIKQALAGLNSYKNAALGGDSSALTSFQRRVTSIQSAIDVLTEKLKQADDNRLRVNIDTDALQTYREQLAEIEQMFKETQNEVNSAMGEMQNEKPEIDTSKFSDSMNTIKQKASSVLKAVKRMASGIASAFATAGKGIKSISARMLGVSGGLDKTTSAFKKNLWQIIKYGFGVRSLYVLFRRLRKAITESFTELQKSGAMWQTTKANVEGLKTALSTLKFQFGAAFEPLFNVVAPALTSFINYLISLMNTISAFIAKLTGRSTYSKVAQVMNNTASSAGSAGKATKELNKQLQAFDELNNISPENNSGSGGGGGSGGGSTGATYTEESVESALGDFASALADKIKEGDWEGVGRAISEKLTEVLNDIPWDSIFKSAENFGRNLADFLNGLITPDLFEALGTTIGNAIKTKLTFLNSLGDELDFPNLGHSIASAIEGFVNTHPLPLMATTFSTWATGITSALATAIRDMLDNGTIDTISQDITTALENLEIGEIAWNVGQIVSGLANSIYVLVSNKETWKQLGTKIGEGIDGFFTSMNQADAKTGLTGWQALGKSISSTISGIADALTEALQTVSWTEVGQAIADFISSIDWGDLFWDLVELAETALGALCEAFQGFWDNATWQEKVGAVIVGMIGVSKLTGLGTTLSTLLDKKLGTTTIKAKLGGLALTVLGITLMGVNNDDGTASSLFENAFWDFVGALGLVVGAKTLGFKASVALKIGLITFAWDFGLDVGSYIGQQWADKMAEDGIISREGADEYIQISKDRGTLGIKWWIDIGKSVFEETSDGKNRFTEAWTNMWGDWFDPLFSEAELWWEEHTESLADKMTAKVEEEWKRVEESFKSLADKIKDAMGITKSVQFQEGVNYEFDENGGIKYAYKSNNNKNASDVIKALTIELNLKTKLNNGEISKEEYEAIVGTYNALYKLSHKNQKDIIINVKGNVKSPSGVKELKESVEGLAQFFGGSSKNAEFNVDVTGDANNKNDVDKLSDSMLGLRNNWKDKNAKLNVQSSAEGTNGKGANALNNLKDAFINVYNNWKDKNAKMSVSKTGLDEAKKSYKELADGWVDKTANFKANIEATGGAGAKSELDDVWYYYKKWDNQLTCHFKIAAELDETSLTNAFQRAVNQVNLSHLDLSKILGGGSTGANKNAKGGVAYKATFGIFGEAGDEALVPLERNTEWLGKVSNMLSDNLVNSSSFGSFATPPTTSFARYENDNYSSNSNSDYLMAELVRETARQNDLLEQILDKPSGITSSEVFRAVRTEGRSFKTRTGNSPFNY